MLLGAAAVTAGFVLGAIKGGTLRSLVNTDGRFVPAAAGALVVLGVTRLGLLADAGAVLAIALIVLVAVALTNLHLPGTGVLAVGIGANAVPVLLHGGTPVDPRALHAVGLGSDLAQQQVLTPTQHLAGPDTIWVLLASAVPVPVIEVVVSFGDLIVAAGLMTLVANAMVRPVRPGIPVRQILEDGPFTIDLTDAPAPTERPAGGSGSAEAGTVPACRPVPSSRSASD